MQNVIYVGIGGFIGAAARYLLSSGSAKLFGSQLPYGTLIVNVIGSILIGIIMEYSMATEIISPSMRLFLTTGILGGLTTFSAFSYETVNLLNEGSYTLGFINAALNIILGFGGVMLGKLIAIQS